MATVDHERENDPTAAAAAAAVEEEDTGAHVTPIVKLEEVAVTTGEEDENAILDLKAKLYRYDLDGKQWKERGGGTVKLLKHNVSGRVRLLMRQSKTLKICANHLVLCTMKLQEHAGNEKSCVWNAPDYADGKLKNEMFCIRFASIENCRTFMEIFQEVVDSQGKNEESSEASDLIEKLNVEEGTPVDKSEGGGSKETDEAKDKSSPVTENKDDISA